MSRTPTYFNAKQLMDMTIPPPRWAVHGLIGEGLTILAGAPKLGKSWLALAIALAVALGDLVLGKIATQAGDVLYLALEDPPRRLQWRIGQLLAGRDAPDRLHMLTEVTDPDVTGMLENWLIDHPDARLIVIDVFAKIRNGEHDTRNAYAADYADAGALKKLADRHKVAIVLVHHTRKMGAEDAFDTISGSTGLTGSADTSLVLRRARGDHSATLHVTGRDVMESEYALTFDSQTGTWTLDGNELAEAARKAAELKSTELLDDTSRAIVAEVGKALAGVRAADVAERIEGADAKTVSTYMSRLADSGRIRRISRGLYGAVESVESVESGSAFHTHNTFNTPCAVCGNPMTLDDGTGTHATCEAAA